MIVAQFDGVCAECGGYFEATAEYWSHFPRCPEGPDERADREAKKLLTCGVCGTLHPGEC
jgi:hypothetical protein